MEQSIRMISGKQMLRNEDTRKEDLWGCGPPWQRILWAFSALKTRIYLYPSFPPSLPPSLLPSYLRAEAPPIISLPPPPFPDLVSAAAPPPSPPPPCLA